MHLFPFTKFSLRHGLMIVLSLIILTGGLLWQGEPASSWAAPAQNPHLQTIPTRSPDVPPSPTPNPTLANPAPTAELTITPVGGDKDEAENDEGSSSQDPTGEKEGNSEGQPGQSPEQKQEEEQKKDRATPTPGSANSQKQGLKNASTPKPGDPVNSSSAGGGGGVDPEGREIAPEIPSSELSSAVQVEAINSVEIAPQAAASATEKFSLLGWLLALILGVVLIMGGVFLVHRS